MRVLKHWPSRPVPGDLQGDVGWGFEQLHLVEDVSDLCRGWTMEPLMAPSNPNYSMIL